MMRRHLAAAALITLAACSHAPAQAPVASPSRTTVSTSSVAPAGSVDLDRFASEIDAFDAADRAAPPAPGGIVFVGSSTIRLWSSLAGDFAGMPVINRGFGGSTFPEAQHYLQRTVVRYHPRTVVVYEGDNDLAGGRTPQQVADDYRAFVRGVRDSLPNARIVFLAIKPSPSRWKLESQRQEANRLVRAIVATDANQTFVDVGAPMLDPSSGRPRPALYRADSLHMTPAGYAIWRATVAPVLK
ncbi:MAG TPA: SGNH/GDSL hydrolase family protein [Gemmatimonadaceae bacterium]